MTTIENCVRKRYQRNNFINLAKSIAPFNTTQLGVIERTTEEEKDKLESFYYLGEVTIDYKTIHLLEVKLKDASLRRSLTFQRNLIAKFLKKNSSDAAIVAFYSDKEPVWRLSLVTVRYKFENGKVVEELPEAKRFSFIVGEGEATHTAEEQLNNLIGKENTYQDILDAFSIEKVTKDFYIKIASAFRKLAGGKEWINAKEKDFGEGVLVLPYKDKKTRQEFAIRLINRIIFCWFLKKKKSDRGIPLIGGEILSTDAVLNYKNTLSIQFLSDNYYHDVIEPLFFEVMNKPLEKRLERYKNEPFKNVPFLNGGLFEPHKEDYYELDENGYFSKFVNMVKVPNEWFIDFFKVLERYNFTVDENTPVEVELSIEPEMLGRIFENLLAEIDPETGETVRKSTGSYYTPRTIVEFMVDESLKHYLMSKTHIEERKIQNLLSYTSEETQLSEEEKDKVLNTLDSLKVIDPAVGSGAFPMGVLQKMLLILQKVDPHNEKWFEKILAKIPDSLVRKETQKKFKDEDLNYIRKMGILRHSIYGVDIQPIATEIARLRAFLSLIVDAKVDDSKENRGIEPLPNLDFKFVTANSLIDVEKIIPEEGNQLIEDPFFEKFEKLTQDYFFESNAEKKSKLRREIEELIDKKVKEKLDHIESLSKVLDSRFGISKERENRIAKLNYEADLWESYKNIFKDESVKFFNIKYFFPEAGNGFDIVIANPPYVRQEKIKDQKENLLRQRYEGYNSTSDLYTYFYEKGYDLLKEGGMLTFISSNKWMRAKYGEKLRKFLKEKTILKELIDFGGYKVFDATVDTNIIILEKNKLNGNNEFFYLSVKDDFDGKDIYAYFGRNGNVMAQKDLDDNAWTLADDKVLALKKKIENIGKPLKDWDVKIYRGVLTGFNDAFIIDTKKRDEILSNCKTEEEKKRTEEIIKPILRGRDIGRYYYKWAGLWVIFIPWHFPLHEDAKIQGASEKAEKEFQKQYSAIYKHLLTYKEQLSNRNKDETGIRYEWYALQRCAATYYPEFEKEKIVWNRITSEIIFSFVSSGLYILDSSFFITGKNLKYIIAVLNSSLLRFWIKNSAATLGTGNYGAKIYIENAPILKIPESAQKPFIDLVDQILAITKDDDYLENTQKQDKVKELEQQIDQLVYKLYNLTPDEISIVEGGNL